MTQLIVVYSLIFTLFNTRWQMRLIPKFTPFSTQGDKWSLFLNLHTFQHKVASKVYSLICTFFQHKETHEVYSFAPLSSQGDTGSFFSTFFITRWQTRFFNCTLFISMVTFSLPRRQQLLSYNKKSRWKNNSSRLLFKRLWTEQPRIGPIWCKASRTSNCCKK